MDVVQAVKGQGRACFAIPTPFFGLILGLGLVEIEVTPDVPDALPCLLASEK